MRGFDLGVWREHRMTAGQYGHPQRHKRLDQEGQQRMRARHRTPLPCSFRPGDEQLRTLGEQ